MKHHLRDHLMGLLLISLVFALVATSCAPVAQAEMNPTTAPDNSTAGQQPDPMSNMVMETPTVRYSLKTNIGDGKMYFSGVGGDIDGKVDPDLNAKPGDVVEITLIDGDGAQHDVTLPDFNAASSKVQGKGSMAKVVFKVEKEGTFFYFCSLPGHRQAGMEGKLIVGQPVPVQAVTAADISRDPTDIPAPIGDRPPQKVRLDLETQELVGQLADGTTYTYWTFNGKVPGPFFRVRVGDQVEVHFKNAANSMMAHSVDFHAVTGPGGGAVYTQAQPGQETSFTFTPLNPGLFIYHCATPMVAQHLASGMYGMILVEPPGGLPKVDREFYVMQGEIYTKGVFGEKGLQEFSQEKLLDEMPEYYVLNGAVGALTKDHPLHANVGETVRIFYGDGGPNKTASFHVIGEIFNRVYDQGSLTSPPLTNVQTTLVPAGGATMVEFKVEVPGRYILVDHALSRMERGLSGYLMVDGPAAPDIIQGTPQAGSGH